MPLSQMYLFMRISESEEMIFPVRPEETNVTPMLTAVLGNSMLGNLI